jgi:uncharacterized membrane protein YbhN (UPF0104 family)
MKSRRLLQLGAAAVATAVVGYFVLRQLKLDDLTRLGRAADARLLALGFACYALANLVRALRFRALTDNQIPTVTLLRTVLIQNFLNTFLPLRAGEVSYLVMVHRTGVVKPGANVASLVGARVLDLIAALAIPLITLPLSRAWQSEGRPFAWFAGAAVVASALLLLGVWRAEWLGTWLGRRAGTSRPWLARGLSIGSDALHALGQLRQGKLLGRVSLMTASCWALLYVSGYCNMLGVGIAAPFWDALFAYSFPMIASMTPFYMLGGFGVFEGSIGFGLHLVGVPLEVGMAGGVLLHVAELLFVALLAPFGMELRPAKTAQP